MKLSRCLFILVCTIFIYACNSDDEDPSPNDDLLITGTITDLDSGLPLEGVSVISSRESTTSTTNGSYSITASPEGLLLYTLEGYKTQDISINNRAKIDIALEFEGSKETTYLATTLEKECEDGNTVTITQVNVTDNGEGTGTITWTNDKVWVLDGFVFVNEGQTLTIEAGTIVKGKSGQGEQASALVVAQGGKLIAVGTVQEPIIFTSEADAIVKTPDGSTCLNTSLGASVRGLWGGVIVLGKARLNAATLSRHIEGIPLEETRAKYGGNEDTDDSGALKYISIRHGGTDIGAGNEINGLTMGGIGSGTTIDHIEVFANKDDGFEWFGGTVNTKYLVSAFNGDDAMDYDEGWRGLNQYWFVYQEGAGDRGGEHDGGPKDCITCEPFSQPVIYNASYRGRGLGAVRGLLTFRDNAAGEYHNSVFWGYTNGIDIEDLDGDEDAYNQYKTGNLKLENNLFHDIASTETIVTTTGIVLPLGSNQYLDESPLNPDFSPVHSGLADQQGTVPSDSFFETNHYKGAFAPGLTPWISNWTRLSDEL